MNLLLCRRWLFIFVLISVPFSAANSQQYNRSEYTVLNGIGQGDINHISIDSLGYIWISQLNGLSRFNGHTFKNIPAHPADTTQLPTTQVWHIHHLPDGNAWLSTDRGLVFYNRKENQFKTYNQSDGLHQPSVLFSHPAGDSLIVAGTFFGYDLLDLRTGHVEWVRPFTNVPDSVFGHRSPNAVWHPKINPFKEDELWSLHRNNLFALDLKSHQIRQLTFFEVGKEPLLAEATYLLEYEWLDADRLLLNFFPNSGQLYIYHLHTRHMEVLPLQGEASLWMNSLKRISSQEVLCLEFGRGLMKLDLEKKHIVSLDSTIKNKAYNTFLREHNGTIWVGERGVVYRYTPTPVISYYTGEENVYLYHIADPSTGTVIVYTYADALAFVLKGGALQPVPFPPLHQMRDNTFFHPYTGQFIYLHDQNMVLFHPLQEPLIRKKVTGIGKTGTITDFEPVPDGFYMAILNAVFYTDLSGRVSLVFRDIINIEDIEYHNGCIYYTVSGAVRKYDTQTREISSLYEPGQDLYMYVDVVQNRLWFGWGRELFHLDLQDAQAGITQSHIPEIHPDMHIHGLSEANGKILVSASFMMMEIDCCPDSLVKTFSFLDNIHIGYWDDRITQMDDGYFLTTDTRKIIAFPYSMPIAELKSYQVEDIDINGNHVSPFTGTIRLRYDQNNIFITSDAVYSGAPDQLSYFYRNTRTSDKWLPMKGHVLQLLDQRPGRYSIDLRVTDRHGQERVISRAFEFDIRPPWYGRVWFYLVASLAVVALAFWVYRIRIRQVRYTYEMQNKLQQLEVSALKTQMNPHFVFNCLNSIKGLILIGEAEKAVSYIGTFSKLVRSSLDNVDEKLITLKEELEIAENYLSLERLRYGSKLTWMIRVPDETLSDRVRLPPFILQPLIENAIVHGIKHITHDGFIHILAFEENGRTTIKIMDNGAGLYSSRQREHRNEHSTRKHLGLSLVERRLKLIEGTLSVREHTDLTGKAEGTISEITIPTGHE